MSLATLNNSDAIDGVDDAIGDAVGDAIGEAVGDVVGDAVGDREIAPLGFRTCVCFTCCEWVEL